MLESYRLANHVPGQVLAGQALLMANVSTLPNCMAELHGRTACEHLQLLLVPRKPALHPVHGGWINLSLVVRIGATDMRSFFPWMV
jgi:hypothetical protein